MEDISCSVLLMITLYLLRSIGCTINFQQTFSIILDIRNESAVAALALHEWALYKYNNNVYTLLFKENSADKNLGEYCRMMQRFEI